MRIYPRELAWEKGDRFSNTYILVPYKLANIYKLEDTHCWEKYIVLQRFRFFKSDVISSNTTFAVVQHLISYYDQEMAMAPC